MKKVEKKLEKKLSANQLFELKSLTESVREKLSKLKIAKSEYDIAQESFNEFLRQALTALGVNPEASQVDEVTGVVSPKAPQAQQRR